MHQKFTEDKSEKNSNTFNYQYVKSMSYVSQDSIRMSIIKNFNVFLIRTDNLLVILDFFSINRQIKNTKKIQLQISQFSRNKFQMMNFCNYFLLISPLQKIEIWKQDKSLNWIISNTIQSENQSEISDFQVTHNDDLIISASTKGIINFWSKNFDWKCSQTIKLEKEFRVGLSLNKQGNKLIVYGEKHEMVLFEQMQNKLWIKKQVIQISEYGQLSFFKDTMFAYMPERSSIIQTYKFSETDQQFKLNQSYKLFAKKIYSYRLQIQYEDSIDALLAIRKNSFFMIRNNCCESQVHNLIRFSNDTVIFTCTKLGQILLTLEQVQEIKDNDYRYVRQLQMRSLRKYE